MFNNAAQVWNHTFFWNCMKPGGGGAPTGAIAEKIEALGGWEKFVEDFKAAAVGRFGSGWAWLVLDNGECKIVSTPNAEIPAAPAVTPLLRWTCGSTPTTSTTRTCVRSTCRRSSTSS